MGIRRVIARPAIAALMGAAALVATSAGAQSPCGSSYTVRPGDTLSRIAARCGTSVGALTGANAFIRDPSRIEVGWTLQMPGAVGSQPARVVTAPQPSYQVTAPTYGAPVQPAPNPYLSGYGNAYRPGTYSVQPGDTFSAIAQALGISIAALMAENSGVNPARLFAGQLLQLPAGATYDRRYDRRYDSRYDRRYDQRWYEDDDNDRNRRPRLRLEPSSGRPGSVVEMRVDRVERGEWLAFGVRDGSGGILKLAEARADSKGRAKARVTVPDWANRRDDLIFVARRQNGDVLRSQPFDVTRRRAKRDDRRDGDLLRRPGRSGTIEGWIVRGVECPVLRTDNGKSYSLVSDDVRLPLGAYVRLTGRPVQFSTCMEGAGTIDVSQLRRIDPPR